jgi:hypothetical protein
MNAEPLTLTSEMPLSNPNLGFIILSQDFSLKDTGIVL